MMLIVMMVTVMGMKAMTIYEDSDDNQDDVGL